MNLSSYKFVDVCALVWWMNVVFACWLAVKYQLLLWDHFNNFCLFDGLRTTNRPKRRHNLLSVRRLKFGLSRSQALMMAKSFTMCEMIGELVRAGTLCCHQLIDSKGQKKGVYQLSSWAHKVDALVCESCGCDIWHCVEEVHQSQSQLADIGSLSFSADSC